MNDDTREGVMNINEWYENRDDSFVCFTDYSDESDGNENEHGNDDEQIPDCCGLQRADWVNKPVSLCNANGVAVAEGICRYSSPSDAIDLNLLGEDDIGILIMKSLNVVDVPSSWVFSLRRWPAKLVFFEGVSLYDQHRRFLEKDRLGVRPPRKRGVRTYITNRLKRVENTPRSNKKSKVMTRESIEEFSLVDCCEMHCCEKMLRHVVLALRKEFWESDHKFRTSILLDVHRRVHTNQNGKQVVTMEKEDICLYAWRLIYSVPRSTFFLYKKHSLNGKRATHHGNLGIKKPRGSTLRATASLGSIIRGRADQMPHKMRTLKDGEHAVEKVLPAGTKWKNLLKEVNNSSSKLRANPISYSNLSAIRRRVYPEYCIKRRGDNFARCGMCDKIKQLRDSQPLKTKAHEYYQEQLDRHINDQNAHRHNYYTDCDMSENEPIVHLCIIHDKMDHAKTASPCFAHKTKSTESFMRLPIAVTGMIAHGHVDCNYAHYSLDLYPADSNHTIASFAKLLRDLELPPTTSTGALFQNSGTTPLHEAILKGKEVCFSALPALLDAPLVQAKKLPPILHVQLDNCWKDNKSRFVFCFWSLLVAKGIFKEVFVNFLLVGHTHDDIDASFGRWSQKLRENDYPTIPLLMKSYMELEVRPVIPHLIEEVADFKEYIKDYIAEGEYALTGHTKAQQFRFYLDAIGVPLMQYKVKCHDADWKPSEGIQLWKVNVEGRPTLPSGEPPAAKQIQMKNLDEILKGLNGFISHWETLSKVDVTGLYRRQNESLILYWRGVCDALITMEEPTSRVLKHGFWPKTRFQSDGEGADAFFDTSLPPEDIEEDDVFVGARRDQPQPSFRVANDCKEGFFVILRAAEGDQRQIWVARALSDPNYCRTSPHFCQVYVQYYMPTSKSMHIVNTYSGWDTKKSFKWKVNPDEDADWVSTKAILASWKPRKPRGNVEVRELSFAIPPAQIEFAKDCLARSEANEANEEDGGSEEDRGSEEDGGSEEDRSSEEDGGSEEH